MTSSVPVELPWTFPSETVTRIGEAIKNLLGMCGFEPNDVAAFQVMPGQMIVTAYVRDEDGKFRLNPETMNIEKKDTVVFL